MSDPYGRLLCIEGWIRSKPPKERKSKMTSLNTICKTHIPFVPAISEVGDDQFTFCENCENNIERWYNDTDPERLPMWTEWKVSK